MVWGFGNRDERTLPHAGPHLLAGFGLARAETYYAIYNEGGGSEEERSEVAIRASEKFMRLPIFVGGVAFDLYPWRCFGLRACWLVRLTLEEEPDYDPEDEEELDLTVVNRGIFAPVPG